MSGTTAIEWATDTWNPTKGCDKVSPGCDHCYAMTMAKRLKGMGSPEYQRDGNPVTSGPGFLAHESPNDLDWPLRKTKPRLIFVNSMSDLFHDNISDEFIAQVFAVMRRASRHTFQVLTKRHGRMRSLVSSESFRARVIEIVRRDIEPFRMNDLWPLPNVWLGVSVENQQWADIRIPALLDTPAAVRFLSCEPLLGPVELPWFEDHYPWRYTEFGTECVCGAVIVDDKDHCNGNRIDWVIAGGESGHGARPMDVAWARVLRDQCVESGIPFLFKQWGSHDEHGAPMNKHKAGRILDGRTWDEYPERAA